MKCAECGVLIDRYIDGELSPPQRRRVDGHLASCASCAREFAEARALAKALRGMPVIKAPRSFEVRLNKKIGRTVATSRLSALPVFVKLPVAAAIIMAVGFSVFLVPKFFSGRQDYHAGLVAQKSSDESASGGHLAYNEKSRPDEMKMREFKSELYEKSASKAGGVRKLEAINQPVSIRLSMNEYTDDEGPPAIPSSEGEAANEALVDAKNESASDKMTAMTETKDLEQLKKSDAAGSAVASRQREKAGNLQRPTVNDIVLSNGGQVLAQQDMRKERKAQDKQKAAKSVRSKAVKSNKPEAERTYNMQIRIPAKQYKKFVKDLSGVGKVDQQNTEVPEKGSIDIDLEVSR